MIIITVLIFKKQQHRNLSSVGRWMQSGLDLMRLYAAECRKPKDSNKGMTTLGLRQRHLPIALAGSCWFNRKVDQFQDYPGNLWFLVFS